MAAKKKTDEKKTMLNCGSIEFIKQANAIKGDVERFVKTTGITKIRSERMENKDGETDEERAAREKEFIHDKWAKMLRVCFSEHTDITMDIIAKMCFTTTDELDKMTPAELEATAVLLLADQRINDFFISLKAMGLFDSD